MSSGATTTACLALGPSTARRRLLPHGPPGCQCWRVSGILRYVDAVTVRVPDLDAGLAFYGGVLGQDLIWRNDSIGAAGLRCSESDTEVVLTTEHGYEPNWKVDSADAVADLFSQRGGRVIAGPHDIPIGRLAVLADPFGNVLVVLDSSKGTYQTDEGGQVTGVS